MAHPYFDIEVPTILGHRGAAGEAPENTLASFARGLELGAHILESDVHLTRDGVPVLIHDEAVDRTTPGSGAIRDLTADEVRELDAGFHWSDDGGESHPFRGQGLWIPTLAEAFAAFPDARFNLELKEDLPGLVEETLALARGREERTLVTAEDDGLMRRVRAELQRTGVHCAVGASTADVVDFVRSAQAGTAPGAESMALQIPAEFGGRPLVTPELIAHARRHHIAVHVWTINEPSEMRGLLDLGVDGLVTDFPGRLVAVLRERRGGD